MLVGVRRLVLTGGLTLYASIASLAGAQTGSFVEPRSPIDTVVQEDTTRRSPAMPTELWFLELREDEPLFVASHALRPEGTSALAPDLLTTETDSGLRSILETAIKEDCVVPSSTAYWAASDFKPGRIWRDLRGADNVVLGTVTGLQPGFIGEQPGVLVRFTVDRVMKGVAPESSYFSFLPRGSFYVGDILVCATDEFHAPVPELGDDLLVLFDDHWFNESDIVPPPGGAFGVVGLSQDGELRLPPPYAESSPELTDTAPAKFLSAVEARIAAWEAAAPD